MRKSALFVIAAASAMILTSNVVKASGAPGNNAPSGLGLWFDVRDNTATPINGYSQQITGAPGSPYTRGQALFSATKKNQTWSNIVTAGSSATPGNGGGPGDAQILRISPQLPPSTNGTDTTSPGNFVAPSTSKNNILNVSVGKLYLYATVTARTGPAAQVLGSLGLTHEVRRSTAAANTINDAGTTIGVNGANPIDSISYAADTSFWSASGISSTVTTVTAGADYDLATKHVKVPVSGPPPVFNATGGLVPSGVYRVATITVTASTRGTNRAATLYNLTTKVNNLLVTRVYNGAGGATPELPAFGYATTLRTGGAPFEQITASGDSSLGANRWDPEAGTTDGSTIGDTSASADAQIVIQRKFDFNNDGAVDSLDVALFQAAIGNSAVARQRDLYLADGKVDNSIDSLDVSQFQRALGVP